MGFRSGWADIIAVIFELVKKVGHIEKSRPLLPRKNKKKQKVRKKSGI